MMRRLLTAALATLLAGALSACPRSAPERPYPEPPTDDLVDYLRQQNERAQSLDAETVMDYWLAGERVRGTVLMMAERGAKVRINALSPAGDTVAADLACDGRDFALVDYGEDCQLTGPCDARSIGRLLGVWLEPDELMLMALGSVPLLADAEIEHGWSEEWEAEEVTLSGPGGETQRIFLEESGEHWDVVGAVLETAEGAVDWELENRDFDTVRSDEGQAFRTPARSRFQQPERDADLAVRWEEREPNATLDPTAFEMAPPAGLPEC